MRSSFVAIISRQGLESLVPECRGAHRWLQQTASHRRTVCLWAVMEREQAVSIHNLLVAGECDWALAEFASAAEYKGPLPVCGVPTSAEAS